MTEPLEMPHGGNVYRIHWIPGSDTLLGSCHCGAERSAEEPVELWDWLLGHPEDHQALRPVTPAPPSEMRLAVPA